LRLCLRSVETSLRVAQKFFAFSRCAPSRRSSARVSLSRCPVRPRRKAIAEPAFGQMKVRQAVGHLRLRGLAGAQGEWTLHVTCHNLRKLANASKVACGSS